MEPTRVSEALRSKRPLSPQIYVKKDRPSLDKYRVKVGRSVITEFNLRAFEVTLKRKKAGLLPLREKSDLFPQTNVF